MQPGWCASYGSGQQGDGRGEQCRFDGEDQIRPPASLAQHDREAAQREGEKMQYAAKAGGASRNPERSAIHGGLGKPRLRAGVGAARQARFGAVLRTPLPAIEASAVAFVNTPVGVVGRRRDDAHLMTAPGEPRRHLPRVFANAREFGGVVETIDKNSHANLPKVIGEDGWNTWG
jgi:hypothetical protein